MFKKRLEMKSQVLRIDGLIKKKNAIGRACEKFMLRRYERYRLEIMLKVSHYKIDELEKFFISINVLAESKRILRKIRKEYGESSEWHIDAHCGGGLKLLKKLRC